MKRSGLLISLMIAVGGMTIATGASGDTPQGSPAPAQPLPTVIPTRKSVVPETTTTDAKPVVTPTPPANIPIAPPPSGQLEAGILAFDGESKEILAKHGEGEARFTFTITNISSANVTITDIKTSCGCTAAKPPANPWILAPGTSGEFGAIMNIAGKPPGTIVKTVTVISDKGNKTVLVKATVPPAPIQAMDREANQKLALADRQAVFKGDCASCHVAPAVGKMGHELYSKACGICHEAEHRASAVPNLHALKTPTNPEYWKNWVTHGKAGSLMPAFAQSEGGPLTDEQITSLVEYLSTAIPAMPTAQLAPPAQHVH